jgi:hypothetical protein
MQALNRKWYGTFDYATPHPHHKHQPGYGQQRLVELGGATDFSDQNHLRKRAADKFQIAYLISTKKAASTTVYEESQSVSKTRRIFEVLRPIRIGEANRTSQPCEAYV